MVKSEDRQDHGQQNEMIDKHRTNNTTLKTKAGVTHTLRKPGKLEGLATPTPLEVPVLLPSRQSRFIVSWYRNGCVVMTVGRYPLSFVK